MFDSDTTTAISAGLLVLGLIACKREGEPSAGEGVGRGPADEAAHTRTTDPSVNDGSRAVDDPAYQAGRSRDGDQPQLDGAPAQGNASGGTTSGLGGSGSGGRTQGGSGGRTARSQP